MIYNYTYSVSSILENLCLGFWGFLSRPGQWVITLNSLECCLVMTRDTPCPQTRPETHLGPLTFVVMFSHLFLAFNTFGTVVAGLMAICPLSSLFLSNLFNCVWSVFTLALTGPGHGILNSSLWMQNLCPFLCFNIRCWAFWVVFP